MRHLLLLAALGVSASACGPNAAAVKRAHEASYDTSYDAVWDAAMAELKARYDQLAVAGQDRQAGIIVSGWKKVEADLEVQDPGGMSGAAALAQADADPQAHQRMRSEGGAAATNTRRVIMMRAKVRVRPLGASGPPWTVEVDAEAAIYRSDMSRMIPWRHDDDNEPIMVRTHADNLSIGIYERLKQYAR